MQYACMETLWGAIRFDRKNMRIFLQNIVFPADMCYDNEISRKGVMLCESIGKAVSGRSASRKP